MPGPLLQAAIAKFNNLKTEIIPLGDAETRNNLIRLREFNGWKIANMIHIAQDGEATRILGPWQGNGINIQAKWHEKLENQQNTMKLCSLSYPSVAGRVLIAKALVVSLAYYLMTVNGITYKHLMTMERNVRKLIWNNRKGQI